MDLTPERLRSENFVLDAHQKQIIRLRLKLESEKLLGIPYKFGAEWIDYSKPPAEIDCSELVEGVYRINGLKMPDGSQNQYNFTLATETPQMGDLGFFGRDGDINKVYHVGMVYDGDFFIEARGFDPKRNFETGKVILRHRAAWERFNNFLGYRSHSKLL